MASIFTALAAIVVALIVASPRPDDRAVTPPPPPPKELPVNEHGKVDLTDEQWRERLTPEQYRILREKGTETAFTGQYWTTDTPGDYRCAGCGYVLFTSDTKYQSHCGWPAFYDKAHPEAVEEHLDLSYGMIRKEVTCARCGGHLGHVFDDGPLDKTGLRYCINSASITLDPADANKPDNTD